ncbi:hypothetical protein A3738_28090 [Oleiphilus sp. HI0066]|nr:hypothetical protein A3738_07675 [Oleiphilus sp. HI0066]KZY67484.1 hypothetical protein A3738_28090 [Oleiphilus sp. HI0066]
MACGFTQSLVPIGAEELSPFGRSDSPRVFPIVTSALSSLEMRGAGSDKVYCLHQLSSSD